MSGTGPTSVEVELDGFAHGGEAVGRIDGKAVFVPGGIPGERVRVRIVDDRRRWARGEIVEVLRASPDRATPPCPYVPECGGCDLQHIAPAAQRRLKTRVVREQLERLGGVPDPPVEDTRAVGPDAGYRQSARFHAVGGEPFDPRLGLHRSGSHDVVPIDDCLVLSSDAQAVRAAVGDRTGAVAVTARAYPGAAVAVLEPGPGPLDLPPDDWLRLAVAQPDGSVLMLRGDEELALDVAGFAYRFDPSCFFQVNLAGAAALVAEVVAAAGDVAGRACWDLYAGVGLLSLPLAAAGARVLAVESHRAAATWAERNAEQAALDVEVRTGKVERFVAEARRALAAGVAASAAPTGEAPDVVVLDPPRRGGGLDLVADLVAIAPPRIVYVACDVAALARDTRALREGGYRLVRAVPLDFFPHTHHVEVVATFSRQTGEGVRQADPPVTRPPSSSRLLGR